MESLHYYLAMLVICRLGGAVPLDAQGRPERGALAILAEHVVEPAHAIVEALRRLCRCGVLAPRRCGRRTVLAITLPGRCSRARPGEPS